MAYTLTKKPTWSKVYRGFKILVFTVDGEFTETGIMEYRAFVDVGGNMFAYQAVTVPDAEALAEKTVDDHLKGIKCKDLHTWLTV